MRFRNKILYISFLLLLSCKNADEPSKILLKGDADYLEGSFSEFPMDMYRPAKLYVIGNKLIVFDDVKEELFKVFKIPTLDYCYSFGKKGGGPDEFHLLDKETINVGDDLEILYRNKLHHYYVTDSSFLKIKSDDKSHDLVLTSVNPINNFKRLKQSLYICNNDFNKNDEEFCLLDLKTKKETKFGRIDKKKNEVSIQDLDAYLSKSICTNESLQRFAAFYYHRPVFKIYNSNMQMLKTVEIEQDKTQFDPKVIYFTEPYETEKYIYVMWICKSKQAVERDIDAFRPEILVFNWDGELLRRIIVNKPIISFAVSEAYKEFYAVSFSEADINRIYKFKLPDMNSDNSMASSSISNDFYSIIPMGNYHFAREETVNATFEKDGYIMNIVNLASGELKKRGKYKSLGGISLTYYAPSDEKADLNKKMREIISIETAKRIDTLDIDKRSVIRVARSQSLKDYYGNVTQARYCDYIQKQTNKIIKFSIFMENGGDESIQFIPPLSQDIERMLSSLRLK